MKTIEEKTLGNSLRIKITNHSRMIAADRWYVKIVCSVKMHLTDEHFLEHHGGDEPELLALIRYRLGDEVEMDLIQERNFVDAEVLDDTIKDLLARISESTSGYLSAESFPIRFFDNRYAEAKKACLAGMAQEVDTQVEEYDEPADFSGCFRD